jgi:hypothetical protein
MQPWPVLPLAGLGLVLAVLPAACASGPPAGSASTAAKASGQAKTAPAIPGQEPMKRLLAGTWRVESLKTGKADLDRDLARRAGEVYSFKTNGTGILRNARGEFGFAWQLDGGRLSLRFGTGDFEMYSQVRQGRDRNRLELEGSFDLDFDNRPDHAVLSLVSP